MAAVRLIALHANRGRTIAQTLGDRTDYAKNPEKTEKGELVTAYHSCRKPKDFEAFIRSLEDAGYEVKRGRYLAVKGKSQQRFIRLSSLGEGYREEDIRTFFAGERKHESKTAWRRSPL